MSAKDTDRLSISRRALLAAGALLLTRPAGAKAKLKVAVFSKHLHFVQGEDLAAAAAGIGFDGVDITVRKGGIAVTSAPVTLTVQLELAATDVPQLLVCAKSAAFVPVIDTLTPVRAVPLLLVSVNSCGELFVPTPWLP